MMATMGAWEGQVCEHVSLMEQTMGFALISYHRIAPGDGSFAKLSSQNLLFSQITPFFSVSCCTLKDS